MNRQTPHGIEAARPGLRPGRAVDHPGGSDLCSKEMPSPPSWGWPLAASGPPGCAQDGEEYEYLRWCSKCGVALVEGIGIAGRMVGVYIPADDLCYVCRRPWWRRILDYSLEIMRGK